MQGMDVALFALFILSTLIFRGYATVVLVTISPTTESNVFQITPADISAANGAQVSFIFNGTSSGKPIVIQSTFDNPCSPTPGGFNSSDIFFGQNTNDWTVFNLTITNDNTPFWFFCTQLDTAPLCGASVVGSINSPLVGDTFAKFQALAASVGGGSANIDVRGGSKSTLQSVQEEGIASSFESTANNTVIGSSLSWSLANTTINVEGTIENPSVNNNHLSDDSSSLATSAGTMSAETPLPTAIISLSSLPKTTSPSSSVAIEKIVSFTALSAHGQTTQSLSTASSDLRTDSSHTPSTTTRDITQTLYTTLPDATKRATTGGTVTGPIIAVISLAILVLILNIFCGIWCIRRARRKSRKHVMDSTDDVFQPLNLQLGLERNRIAAFMLLPKRERYQRLSPSRPRFSIFKRNQHNNASRHQQLVDVDSPSTPFVIGDAPDDLPPPTYCAVEGA